MESFRLGKNLFSLTLSISVLLFFAVSAQALIGFPDSSEAAGEYAWLVANPDGSIHGVKASIKTADIASAGLGQLQAYLYYEQETASGEWKIHQAVSKLLTAENLSPDVLSLMTFDFAESPVPAGANPVSLKIYRQDGSQGLPLAVMEFDAELLIMEEKAMFVQTSPPPEGGVLIWGPETFIREQGKPVTEQIFFSVEEKAGPFLLRLTNGAAEAGRRVSSAVIKMNGEQVFQPSEFNQQAGELSRQVVLLPGENLIEVSLRSAPGSQVTLELFHLGKKACTVYSSRSFLRYEGKPLNEVEIFELNPGIQGPYILTLNSGNPDGTQRIDSAVVTLNAVSLLSSMEFNEQVGFLTREVALQAQNTLSVELRGAPGDFLTIGITGYDDIPPKVTFTSPRDREIISQGPITITGTVDDPEASLTINGAAVPTVNGSFILENMAITEEGTRFHAVATDTCGNQGDNEITVFLRPPMEGPRLTFCVGGSLPSIAERAASCRTQTYSQGLGRFRGTTDETAEELSVNGTIIPKGNGGIIGVGDIDWAYWDGYIFEGMLLLPDPDGTYPIKAIAKDKAGGKTEATVTFIKDTVPPKVAITFPPNGWATKQRIFTVTGTVDDPAATVYSNGYPIPVDGGVFTTEVNLEIEEPYYILIRALDRAWNSAEELVMVILDLTPPEIKITSLSDGMIVNTPSLAINGTIVDETPESVSVAVNGGSPQPLAMTEKNFSGVVPISRGSNNLIFTATDQAGNTSQVSRSVFLDPDPPVVTIASPAAGADVSGMLSIAVNADDAGAGVAGVSLFLDGSYIITLTKTPYSHSLDTSVLPMGSHTITVRVTDHAGNQAEATVSFNVSHMVIEIISPANGAAIDKSRAIVQGKLQNRTGEVGVVVNGILAEVQGDDFAVVVPLRIGQNTLTATATDSEGLKTQNSVNVITQSLRESFRLIHYPLSGTLKEPIDAADITFEVEAYLDNPVAGYSWDFNADGVPEAAGAEPKITFSFLKTGIYFPKVVITDSQGNTFEETTIVQIVSKETVEAVLRSKWDGMKGALVAGDIEGALQYFVAASRDKYRQIFAELGSERINYLFADIIDFKVFTLYGRTAGCGAVRLENGKRYAYGVNFVQDENGLWKIMGL